MKMFLAVLLVAAASADRLENTYLPPGTARTAGGSGSFLNAPSRPAAGRFGGGGGSGPAGPIAGAYSGPTSPPIAILRLNNDNNGDGTYQFDFETENRITQQETGQLKNAGTDQESNVVQGSYSYAAPDGQTITVNYIADENGFQPQGAHLPTAPPVPEEILKALEQNAKDEAAGIIDDGQYRAEQQGPGAFRAGGGAGAGGAVNRQYLAPSASGNRQSGYRY